MHPNRKTIRSKGSCKTRFTPSVQHDPNSREWLTVNYVVNATGTILLRFYIFKGERICDDYIQFCKPRTCMAMQSKAWMATFLFKEFLSFFKRSIPSGISITNRRPLILDGHRSHVTLEAIE
jgi:hypothetical protein